MSSLKKISGFRPELLSEEFVQNLLLIVSEQNERISILEKEVKSLKAEIRSLKKLPKQPEIKASKLDEDSFDESDSKPEKSRQTGKRRKKENLEIHEKKIVKAVGIPADWHLSGYKTKIIQDFIIRANNILDFGQIFPIIFSDLGEFYQAFSKIYFKSLFFEQDFETFC